VVQDPKKPQIVHTLSTQNIARAPSNIQIAEITPETSPKPRSKTLPKSVSWVIKVNDTEESVDI
jgi:hypothetical protein